MIETAEKYYENQRPLSNVELEMINNHSEYIKIRNIKDFPKTNTHIEVEWVIPACVTRNEDRFWITNEEPIKANSWVVYPKIKGFVFEVTQFEKFNDAILYAVEVYMNWIESHNTKVDKVLDSLMISGIYKV